MKDISQYPVTFPYGATTNPYTASNPHRGEDRVAPCNTPVIVSDTLIGLVGTTGKSTGCHLHIQKVAGGVVQHPRGGGLSIPIPATVYETGSRTDIGNYVRIRDAQGTQWSYFHLSKISVSSGQKITSQPQGGTMVADRNYLDVVYRKVLERQRGAGEGENVYLNKDAGWVFLDISNSAEARKVAEAQAAKDKAITDLQIALANEQGRPPKEIIKEVQVIIEKPVEVIKEIEVIREVPMDERKTVENWLVRLWRSLFNR